MRRLFGERWYTALRRRRSCLRQISRRQSETVKRSYEFTDILTRESHTLIIRPNSRAPNSRRKPTICGKRSGNSRSAWLLRPLGLRADKAILRSGHNQTRPAHGSGQNAGGAARRWKDALWSGYRVRQSRIPLPGSEDPLEYAYGVKPYQITGPDWMATTRFDIVAKMPQGSTKDDAPKMLQSLLEDRFNLMAHRASAEHPVLALVMGKGGPKLKASPNKPVAIDESAPLKPGEMKMDGPEGPVRAKSIFRPAVR